MRDMPFSGRIYFYIQASLSAEERTRVESLGQGRSVSAIVRDEQWAAERGRFERPLAFISHDSRVATIAQPLALGLIRRMCPVWFTSIHSGLVIVCVKALRKV